MRIQGARNRQTFRVVVTDQRNPLDGKYVENLGWYNPFAADEKNVSLDVPRLQYWIGQGAQISDRVKALVQRVAPEVVREITSRAVAKREKARKERKAAAKKS
jgi:small subunit ribosomal protein S16